MALIIFNILVILSLLKFLSLNHCGWPKRDMKNNIWVKIVLKAEVLDPSHVLLKAKKNV